MQLAADSNAVIDFTRSDRVTPPPLHQNPDVALPLPVVGELLGGARMSSRVAESLEKIESLLLDWNILLPDVDTARIYGQLRARARRAEIKHSLVNDLWIAALCLQHNLPLLTNDRGFDSVAGLTVIHW